MTDSYIIVEIWSHNPQGVLIGKLRNSELEAFLDDPSREFISITQNQCTKWACKQDIDRIIIYEHSETIQMGDKSATSPEKDKATV